MNALGGLAVLVPLALPIAAAESAIMVMNSRRFICTMRKPRDPVGDELFAVSYPVQP